MSTDNFKFDSSIEYMKKKFVATFEFLTDTINCVNGETYLKLTDDEIDYYTNYLVLEYIHSLFLKNPKTYMDAYSYFKENPQRKYDESDFHSPAPKKKWMIS